MSKRAIRRAAGMRAMACAALLLAATGAATAQPDGLHSAQQQAFVEAMKPRHERKPVVAILALNDGTEITDFLLTHAVLKRSGAVDVHPVAEHAGRVALYPALEVDGVMNFAAFDHEQPGGADYVIVPAMRRTDDAAVLAWLKAQAARGARIVGVCAGAVVVGRAGLLDGKRFVTHWFYRDDVLEHARDARFVPDQRYLVDGDVATTTGISASVPAMLALVEAIAGRERAAALAAELGVGAWTPEHDSAAFGLTAGRMTGYVLNKLALWNREDRVIDVRDGLSDIPLAFAADAWSRTGRVSVTAAASGPVTLRSGLRLVARPAAPRAARVPLDPLALPVQQLDRTLCQIGQVFGEARREWVRMELEYPDSPAACGPAEGLRASRK